MHVWEDYLLIYLIIYLLGIIFLKFKFKKCNVFLLCFTIMYIYGLEVCKYTLFPIPYDEISIEVFSEGIKWSDRINLIPFVVESKFTLTKAMLLNILLTIPLGFGISFLYDKKLKVWKIVLIGTLSGIAIELTQLIISIGLNFPYRIIDITDIICNFMGCIVGYILFLCFARVWVYLSESISMNNALFIYIKDVCKNNIKCKI